MNKNFITFLSVLVVGLMFIGFVSFNNDKFIGSITGNVVLSGHNFLTTEKIAKNISETNDEILKAFNNGNEKVKVIVLDKKSSHDFEGGGNKVKKIKHSYSSVNGFSAEITLDEFEALNNSGVNIIKDKIYQTSLDVSILQIGADDVWSLEYNNLNLTGSSQTVCIIDTGVNYSHSAFGNCYGANNISSTCKIIGGYDFVNDDDDPMDDNGHGTHVAGIIASSDSTYRGVSPNVKIISIKALDSDGSGWGGDVVAGIDWCVNNASKFNISIISMSLGDDSTHDSYCNSDINSGGFYSYIVNAVVNNITVVVSAGNCDQTGQESCTTGVASPACVEDAIIAGAVNDDDSISGAGFMRGALLELMAPGVDIISSVISGAFGSMSGTSMSAPHVAGAIALINQYLELSGQTKTPSEIEIILNNTGVVLDDNVGSGYNFSRIDVYSAILSLDIDSPNITLVLPINNKINLTVNQSFVCNAMDWQLANVTLKVWNSTGLYYNTTNNLTGTVNETNFSLNNMDEGSYEWNCLSFDVEGNFDYAPANFSLTIGGISVNLINPLNNTYTNINETNFTCNLTSEENYALSNVTFYLWNSSGLVSNETKNISGISNLTIFTYNLTEETSYSWNCLGVNNRTNELWGENNFSLTYDETAPNITLTRSLPTSETSNSASKDFRFNVSEENIANCSLIVDNITTVTNSSVSVSKTQSFSQIFTSGTYTWKINCNDLAGNINSSVENNFTITAVPVAIQNTGGSGGSSGSSSIISIPKTYEVGVVEVYNGYTRSLKKNEKVNFSIFDFEGGQHLLTINDIDSISVNITIESDPINLKLGIGQSVKLNLTSPIYYDLFVKLNKIAGDSAEIVIQLINEPIETKIIEINRTEVVEKEVVITEYDSRLVLLLTAALIISIYFIIFLIMKGTKTLKRRKMLKKKHSKHGKNKKT